MTALLCAVLLMRCAVVSAQGSEAVSREVTKVNMVGIGATNILDTYLSPEKYRGVEMRIISHATRQWPDRRWRQHIIHQGNIASADDRAEDGNIMGGLYTFSFGMTRETQLHAGRLSLAYGAVGDANIGALYNSRNQNNPAQLRLSMAIGPFAMASYRLDILGKPVIVNYELAVPLIGLMFSPNYGQSYYEIFSRGDYDHNAVVTTPFSAPSLRHFATLDFRLFHSTWRIGYLGDVQQSEVNHLKQHVYTHSLVIGVVRHLNITRKR